MKQLSFLHFLLIITLFTTTACNKCEIGPQGIPSPSIILDETTTGFLVINEGNFNFGNSTLSYFDSNQNTLSSNVFESINQIPLGDTFQSIAKINGNYYFVLNNSGKIIIVDSTFHVIDEIENLTSPRYILQVNETTAYVSDLFSNEISVIDLNENNVISTIALEGWSEKMFKINNQVFVQENTSNKLVVLDPLTNQIIDNIQLSAGISGVIVSNNNNIWVLCNGGFLNESDPILYQIDNELHTVIQTFDFGNVLNRPNYLTYNSAENCIYFSQNGIMKMNCNASTLPTEPLIPNTFSNLYGLDFNNSSNEIIITDAMDFVSQGLLHRYTENGNFINEYTVGVNPNGIFVIE